MNTPFFSTLDEWSDITDITFRDRKRLGPLDKASHQIMRGKGKIPFALRELMAAYVSGLNACSFCFGSHEAVAQQFGMKPEILEQLLDDVETAPINDKERPLFHYLKKLTLSPAKLYDKDAEAVFNAGWSEEDLHLTILIGCLFNFYNRLLDGHGVKGNGAIYKMGGKHLATKGYKVPWFISAIKAPIFRAKRKQLKSQLR